MKDIWLLFLLKYRSIAFIDFEFDLLSDFNLPSFSIFTWLFLLFHIFDIIEMDKIFYMEICIEKENSAIKRAVVKSSHAGTINIYSCWDKKSSGYT